MSENKKSSAIAKARTIARRKDRARKDIDCGRFPLHSEFVMQQIITHRAERGWN